jgi:hypothetical protein
MSASWIWKLRATAASPLLKVWDLWAGLDLLAERVARIDVAGIETALEPL